MVVLIVEKYGAIEFEVANKDLSLRNKSGNVVGANNDFRFQAVDANQVTTGYKNEFSLECRFKIILF